MQWLIWKVRVAFKFYRRKSKTYVTLCFIWFVGTACYFQKLLFKNFRSIASIIATPSKSRFKLKQTKQNLLLTRECSVFLTLDAQMEESKCVEIFFMLKSLMIWLIVTSKIFSLPRAVTFLVPIWL